MADRRYAQHTGILRLLRSCLSDHREEITTALTCLLPKIHYVNFIDTQLRNMAKTSNGVRVQPFEVHLLTYTPSYPPVWRVENVSTQQRSPICQAEEPAPPLRTRR